MIADIKHQVDLHPSSKKRTRIGAPCGSTDSAGFYLHAVSEDFDLRMRSQQDFLLFLLVSYADNRDVILVSINTVRCRDQWQSRPYDSVSVAIMAFVRRPGSAGLLLARKMSI